MRVISRFAIAFATCATLFAPQAKAEVVRMETAETLIHKKTPVYVWQDTSQKPRAVAVAIHGLVMHGGVYDALAKKLAADGIVVVAPDLRGFGRWQQSKGKEAALDYDKSNADINELVKAAKEKYPKIPLYCIGESLGAGLAMKVALDNPSAVNGLILSSPALKPHYFVGPMLSEAPKTLVDVRRKLNLCPYIKKFASEDPAIIAESLSDPLVTKRMTPWQLVQSVKCMRPNLSYAKKLPSHIPMLVIQGDQDRMLRTNAVVQLVHKTKVTDQTVRWFSNRGHLLIETAYLQPETVTVVTDWLHEHMQPLQVQISGGESSPETTNIASEQGSSAGI